LGVGENSISCHVPGKVLNSSTSESTSEQSSHFQRRKFAGPSLQVLSACQIWRSRIYDKSIERFKRLDKRNL